MTNTFDWICATLVQDYQLDAASLTPDTTLETLGIDSLAIAELLFKVEDVFRITVSSESELVPLSTLGEIVDFIDKQVSAQHGSAGVDMVVPSVPPSP
jgi:acyl carrier protein